MKNIPLKYSEICFILFFLNKFSTDESLTSNKKNWKRIKAKFEQYGSINDAECIIQSTKSDFSIKVPFSKSKKLANKIWDNPSKYSKYKNPKKAYIKFLRYLFIYFPDGSIIPLGVYAKLLREKELKDIFIK